MTTTTRGNILTDSTATASTLTAEKISHLVDVVYHSFMAGWSNSSSMANLRDVYADDPSLRKAFPDRNLFLAAGHRALRGFYNYSLDTHNDIERYVAQAFGE